jgi:23S rRNA pseudouridine1911/1915/1917 synthase
VARDDPEPPAAAGAEEIRLQVEEDAAGERLDRYVTGKLAGVSRSQIQSWIRDGRVDVDGRPARSSHPVGPGEVLCIRPPEPAPPSLEPLDIPLAVVYEDEHLAVVDKPPGLQVHPGSGPPRPTLAHALLHRYPGWRAPGSPDRPGILHRLDRDTSGLLVVARTPLAFQGLGKQIRSREVTRRYVALIWGSPEADAGTINAPIGRHPRDRRRMAVVPGGRPATTEWRILHRFDRLSLVDVRLRTGRTHQIRVHLAHAGFPLFGDPAYGHDRSRIERLPAGERPGSLGLLRRLRRQALHAYHLAFRHPAGGAKLRFEAPVPPDLDQVLIGLGKTERNE